ncbi:MAG: aminoacyl-tRNA hydrolase [Wenzhouxiangellaceae bacterium]
MGDLWLIAGLGNPGPRYTGTRHNAGFWLLERLSRKIGVALASDRKVHGSIARGRIADRDVLLLAPETWMNESGRSVQAAAAYYRINPEQLVVAHDELDLPPGVARLKFGGGHGGHNGLRSLFSHLGTRDFWRLRLGIGHPGQAEQVTPWVLSRPSADDESRILQAVDQAVEVLPELLSGSSGRAMQALNSRERGTDGNAL